MARSPRQPVIVTLCVALAVVVLCLVAGETPLSRVDAQPAPSQTTAVESRVSVDPVRDWSELRLAEMSTEDKVRSLLMLRVPGLDSDQWRITVASVASGGVGAGGFILMRDNVPATPEELAALTAAAVADPELPPIVGIDEEGGDVVRLPYDDLPGADYLRGVGSNETVDAFAARAALLASVGVNLNFGIVADYTADPNSFIHSRTLGDDPASAADHVAAAVGAESPVVASTLKHFPGHGRTNADSHNDIPVTDVSFDEWRATDAVPFEAGIDAGAPAIMFGHLVFSSVDAAPATLSPAWHDILRNDLGFDGLIVTDDLLMLQSSGLPELADPYANAVAALAAGNDVLLYVLPSDPSTVGIDVPTLVTTLVANVSAERIDESALRVLMFRRALAPDALTWVPPCDLSCAANELGGTIPFQPLILVSDVEEK
jgi:beta-N-acetylhexosaminidase